jgi:hypothetical protein
MLKARLGMEIAKPYDNGSKRLLSASAQDLLDWLSPGAMFTGQFSETFHSAELEADSMIETLRDGERELVQVEFQSSYDPHMPQRIIEYSLMGFRRHQCPVRSYVLYLRKSGKPPRSPLIRKYNDGQRFLWFRYTVIQIWNMEYREWLDQDRKGLFPLVPLMKGGARREVVEEVIERLRYSDGTIENSRELLELTGLFSGLAFIKPNDKEWSKERFAMLKDVFKDNFMYDFFLEQAKEQLREQGREQGLEQGREQGLEQGREQMRKQMLQTYCENLMSVFRERYPDLLTLAERKLANVEQPEILEKLLVKMALARNEGEVQQYLLKM